LLSPIKWTFSHLHANLPAFQIQNLLYFTLGKACCTGSPLIFGPTARTLALEIEKNLLCFTLGKPCSTGPPLIFGLMPGAPTLEATTVKLEKALRSLHSPIQITAQHSHNLHTPLDILSDHIQKISLVSSIFPFFYFPQIECFLHFWLPNTIFLRKFSRFYIRFQ
jgi:hypothetical protein